MEVMWLLIPLSTVLVLFVIAVFGWALHRGQFDDLEDEGTRIFHDEAQSAMRAEPAPSALAGLTVQSANTGPKNPSATSATSATSAASGAAG